MSSEGPVHTVAEGCARLSQSADGRELLSYFVRVSDLCRLIRATPRVQEKTKSKLVAAVRRHAAGSEALPYYLFTLIIGEAEAKYEPSGRHEPHNRQHETECDFQRIIRMIRRAGPEHLPALDVLEITLH